MECAELLKKLHLHPKRTLRVIAWMDEESGGAGSQAYTKDYSAEFPRHVAAIESDAGAAHPLGFDVKISPKAMDLLRRNGGLERIHIAFYRDPGTNDNHRWHFWRLEGPGFVWNYRVRYAG